MTLLRQEAEILQQLDHPNIVKFKHVRLPQLSVEDP